jgi:hypothetical protein
MRKRRPTSRERLKHVVHFFRRCVGGDVEILRRDAEQHVANAATD